MDPKLSVIIPTLNEEDTIVSCIQRVRETSTSQSVEVIVVDGGSQDGTVEAAGPIADKLLCLPKNGRGHQMHQGALSAQGELLLFLHSDTRLPADWAPALLSCWREERPPAAAAFRLSFDRPTLFFRLLARGSAIRTRLTGVPLGDQALALRRADYFAAGGFPDMPLMEEYGFIRNLKKLGTVSVLPQAVTTSSRRYLKNGLLMNVVRNSLITSLYGAGVRPELLARFYR